jgi:hypothetical protein
MAATLSDPVTDYEEAVEVGYLGQVQDPEPNETYTVTGKGKDNAEVMADALAAQADWLKSHSESGKSGSGKSGDSGSSKPGASTTSGSGAKA